VEDEPFKSASGVDTVVLSESGPALGRLDGVAVWPPVGSVVELGPDPNRDAIVRDVRLQVPSHGGRWLVVVRVQELERPLPLPARA
jgi:hypothetical protein